MKISCVCAHCKSPFLAWPVELRKGRVYCGKVCAAVARTRSSLDRFWEKVKKDGPIPEHCPELGRCWIWIAGKHQWGYGRVHFDGRVREAHRISWALHHGPIPAGLWVLHRCDNPPCCNPEHLFLGTNADNRADSVRKGRHAKGDSTMARRYPEKILRGEQSPHAKLTAVQVQAIRDEYAIGNVMHKDLAARYGVTESNIGAIIRRETWAI